MKKLLFVTLALSLVLSVLVGCTSTPAPTTTTAPTTSVAPKPATTTSVAPTTSAAPTTTSAAPKPTTAAPTTTAAPATWKPEKFVTWIVGAGPGGGFDLYSRAVSAAMGRGMGTEFVVKNVPGAGGVTGLMQFYRSKNDGYTMALIDTEKRISESLVSKQDYDFNQIVWVGGLNQYYSVLCVSAKSPWNTVEDIKKATVDRPFRLACQDVGAVEAISMPSLGINAKPISGYAGSAESIVAVVKGDADGVAYPDNVSLPFIKSGDLKPILYFAPKDSEVLSAAGIKVPNAAKDYPAVTGLLNTRAVGLPPGTPENIRAAYEAAMLKALGTQEMKDWSAKTSNLLNPIPASQLKDDFKRQQDVYAKFKDILAKYM